MLLHCNSISLVRVGEKSLQNFHKIISGKSPIIYLEPNQWFPHTQVLPEFHIFWVAIWFLIWGLNRKVSPLKIRDASWTVRYLVTKCITPLVEIKSNKLNNVKIIPLSDYLIIKLEIVKIYRENIGLQFCNGHWHSQLMHYHWHSRLLH